MAQGVGVGAVARATPLPPTPVVAYLVPTAVVEQGLDGTGALPVMQTGPQLRVLGLALSPDATKVAMSTPTDVVVASLDPPGAQHAVQWCSCRAGLRWADGNTLVVAETTGDVRANATTGAATPIPGGLLPVESLSPDLQQSTLVERVPATGMTSLHASLPLHVDLRLPAHRTAAWSPDGSTVAISVTQTNGRAQPVQNLMLVDAATGALRWSDPDSCPGGLQGDPVWAPDGNFFLLPCSIGPAVWKWTADGAASQLAVHGPEASGLLSVGGGPQPNLSAPAVPLTSVTATAIGPGRVLITADVPAVDNAGARVTTSDGGRLRGRMIGGRLEIDDLLPGLTYGAAVEPMAWNGTVGHWSNLLISTDPEPGTFTALTAPRQVLWGSRVSARARVTRPDSGAPVAGKRVFLRGQLVTGRTVTLASGTTDVNGYVVFRFVQRDDVALTAVAAWDTTTGGSTSPIRTVLAGVRTRVAVGIVAGRSRVVGWSFSPARLVTGLVVRDLTTRRGVTGCRLRSCRLARGHRFSVQPLGEVVVGGRRVPAGPAVVFTVRR